MAPQDEEELDRLSEILRSIDGGLESGSPQREALQKAGLALSLAFARNLRSEIDRHYEQLGQPLTEPQRAHLQRMGIDPGE